MLFRNCQILENCQLADSTFRITLDCPEIAQQMVPGQFAMLRIADQFEAILGRAFAMWDRTLDSKLIPQSIQFVYLVKGRMTSKLATMQRGERIDVWGPLGNGFDNSTVDQLVMVAGGVGQTPMLTLGLEALGKQTFGNHGRAAGFAKKVTLIYGARSSGFLAGLSEFESAGLHIITTTEDGTAGRTGRVTDPLIEYLTNREPKASIRIACCGPEPMMQAVSDIASEFNVGCEVSLETPMACGIGICFSCVAKVKQSDGDWDYRRTCVEGPVFDAKQICW